MNSEARPHRESQLRLLAGAAVAGALVVAAIVSMIGDRSPEASGESGVTPTNAMSTLTVVGTRGLTAVRSVEPTAFRDSNVRLVSEQVLDAWGRFATTGDLDPLRTLFHPLSPQLPLLEAEAERAPADSLERPPYVFTMEMPVIKPSAPGFVTVEGSVVNMREGEFVSRATWLLVVTQLGDQETWMIWTLEEVE